MEPLTSPETGSPINRPSTITLSHYLLVTLTSLAMCQVISVVIADPLYKWAMTPLKAKQRQQERGGATVIKDEAATLQGNGPLGGGGGVGGGERPGEETIGNADAERAVLRVSWVVDRCVSYSWVSTQKMAGQRPMRKMLPFC